MPLPTAHCPRHERHRCARRRTAWRRPCAAAGGAACCTWLPGVVCRKHLEQRSVTVPLPLGEKSCPASNGRGVEDPAGTRARRARSVDARDGPEKKLPLSRAAQRRCSAQTAPPSVFWLSVRACMAESAHTGTVALPPCRATPHDGSATILGTFFVDT